MIKEPKYVDFYTTGRQPSKQDFARIIEWIKQNKQIQPVFAKSLYQQSFIKDQT